MNVKIRLLFAIFFLFVTLPQVTAQQNNNKPNIILMMCDDLGWGDTGFNGNKIIKTPQLDQMAKEGAVLSHFYSIGPVCSPTRASFLTGRHYYRMGVFTANKGHLPKEEYTIAKMLKKEGYETGHFGKWHLGTLNDSISNKGKRRKPKENFAPPWLRDYDQSFVTESATATWDPGIGRRSINNPYYENGEVATQNLLGCDSRVLMDRAIPFIQQSVKKEKPFVAVIWFHAPHEDIVAGPEYLKMYKEYGEAAHYYGCVTAVDDQVGRLRNELKKLGVDNNTALFFCSDNGPEGKMFNDPKRPRRAGKTGGFTGRKRSVYEGGVRVPALALWPKHIKAGSKIDVPCSVMDYLPTVAAITNAELLENRTIDGENILPVLKEEKHTHEKSIPFRYGDYACLVKENFKLIIESPINNENDKLFNLSKDKTEVNNLVNKYPEKVEEMRGEIMDFLKRAELSHSGLDYGNSNFKPVDSWQALGLTKQSKGKKNNKEKQH